MSRGPTLLLGCYEVPFWGGAATVHYGLFARLQRAGHAARYVNLVAAAAAPGLAAALGPAFDNPERLAGVATCHLPEPFWRPHDELAALIAAVRPDLLVARGFIAAWLMRAAAPRTPLVFLTAGCRALKTLLERGLVDDFADFADLAARGVHFPLPARNREAEAIAGSDLVVLHSPHVRRAFEHFYPSQMGRAYERLIFVADDCWAAAQPFAGLARPFAERDIDVLFVASDWRRHEKNYPLVARLADACGDLRLHLVGAAAPADGRRLTRHGLVADRAALFALYGRARAVVCPSRFDAAPGVLFEAAAMGCNVVATPNCGNWQLCHATLLAPTDGGLAARVRAAVAAPRPDNRHHFLGGHADLLDTLLALA